VAVGLYGIVFLLVGLILGVLIGAILFRAGVSLANKVLGPQAIKLSDKEQPVGETFINASVAKNANPYAAPASPSAKLSQVNTAAIPEPNMGKACGIVLVHALIAGMINFFVYLLLQDSLVSESDPWLLACNIRIQCYASDHFWQSRTCVCFPNANRVSNRNRHCCNRVCDLVGHVNLVRSPITRLAEVENSSLQSDARNLTPIFS